MDTQPNIDSQNAEDAATQREDSFTFPDVRTGWIVLGGFALTILALIGAELLRMLG